MSNGNGYYGNFGDAKRKDWTPEEEQAAHLGRGLALLAAGDYTQNADNSIDFRSVTPKGQPVTYHTTVLDCDCPNQKDNDDNYKAALIVAQLLKGVAPKRIECLHIWATKVKLGTNSEEIAQMNSKFSKLVIEQTAWKQGKIADLVALKAKIAAEGPLVVTMDNLEFPTAESTAAAFAAADARFKNVVKVLDAKVVQPDGRVIEMPRVLFRIPDGYTPEQAKGAVRAFYARKAQYPTVSGDQVDIGTEKGLKFYESLSVVRMS